MKNEALKIVPMPQESENERFYRQSEDKFFKTCERVRRGATVIGYQGELVFDLMQSIIGMYAHGICGGARK